MWKYNSLYFSTVTGNLYFLHHLLDFTIPFYLNSSCKSWEIGMLMLRVKEESSPMTFFKAEIDTCSCLLWQLKVKTFVVFMGH